MDTQTVTKNALSELLDTSREQDTHKADYTNPAREFTFDAESRLNVSANMFGLSASMSPLAPTDWAWRQVFSKLGASVFGKGSNKTLPADYLLALKPELRAHVLNEHIQRADGKWMARAYDDKCRAVLSGGYAAIGNTEVLDMLNQISTSTEQPHTITHSSSVDPDSLNVRVIWKDVRRPDNGRGDGDWGIGVYIGNGETGNRRLRILPLVQRHSCQNSIIVDSGAGGVEFVHVGNSHTKMMLIKAAMLDILPFAANLLDKMLEADAQEIPDFADVLNGLAKEYHWDTATSLNVAAGTEARETRAALVNGITYAAQKIESPDGRADMEILGGSILVAKDSLFYRMAEVSRK